MSQLGRLTSLPGRDRELLLAQRAVGRAETLGQAGVLFTGEAGIGKSHLLREAVSHLPADALVLQAGCLDVGDAAPYQPLHQALLAARDGLPNDPLRRSAMASVLNILEQRRGPGPSDAAEIVGALVEGLHRLSSPTLLVLALDDLQWCDRATQSLIVLLLAGLTPLRVLLLGAATSPGDTPGFPRLARALSRLEAVTAPLAPLSVADVAQAASLILGRSLSPAEANHLHWRTGGLPFAIDALVRGSTPDGLMDAPPPPLREVVLDQFRPLTAEARDVLDVLTVAAAPVTYDVLSAVTSLSHAVLRRALRAGLQARLVVSLDERYGLRHGLIHQVLDSEIPPAERRQIHLALAQVLRDDSDASDSLEAAQRARHWRLAGEPGKALTATLTAADAAERLQAHADAWTHWREALELAVVVSGGQELAIPGPGLAPGLVSAAAEAAHRAGDHEAALAVLGDTTADPRGLLVRTRSLVALGRGRQAVEEFHRQSASLNHGIDVVLAAEIAQVLLDLGRYDEARSTASRVIEDSSVARSEPAGDQIIDALITARAVDGFARAYLQDADGGRRSVEESLACALETGTMQSIGRAHVFLTELLTGPLNLLDEGVAHAERAATWADDAGLRRTYGARLRGVAGNGLFRAGTWAHGREIVDAALDAGPVGVDACDLLLSRARLVMALGDLEAAERDLRAAESLVAEEGFPRLLVPLATLRAGLALWRHDTPSARAAVRQGLREIAQGPYDAWLAAPLVWHGLRTEADAAALAADGSDAALVAQLHAALGRVQAEATHAAAPIRQAVAANAALCQGELSRLSGEYSAGVWERAVQAWEERQHPYPATYARFRAAEAHLTHRTRSAEGRKSLLAAYESAASLGAEPLLGELRALAKRARIDVGKVRTRRVSGRAPVLLDLLSARELEVLATAARGGSNRAVGAELFISDRTVGVHMSNIMRKLGVRSRVEAVTVYLRDGTDAST